MTRRANGCSFLLESAENNEQIGRYSVPRQPARRSVFESRGKEVDDHGAGRHAPGVRTVADDPFAELQRFLSRYRPLRQVARRDERSLPFSGGAVGFLGYDAVRFFERHRARASAGTNSTCPRWCFSSRTRIIIFDHRFRQAAGVGERLHRGAATPALAYDEARAQARPPSAPAARPEPPAARTGVPGPAHLRLPAACNTSREEYEGRGDSAAKSTSARAISSSSCPPSVSRRLTQGDALSIYRALRFINPSPYMFLLRFGNRFSAWWAVRPRCTSGRWQTAAWRSAPSPARVRRGRDPRGGSRNWPRRLLADPKERAEHLMLVDLARNDVGRVAEFGSVRVTDFMTIERYSHVMHIVSNVVGRLAGGTGTPST